MTTSTDAAGHPEVDEIADLAEGLLLPPRSADVERHLDGCGLCSDVRASLEEIRGLLDAVPEPAHMPADVVDRIDAALAAEGRVSRETSLQPPLALSASLPSDRPAGRPHAATGPGRKDRGRGRRRRTVALGAVLTAAVLGAGSLVLESLGSGSSDTTAHSKPSLSASPFSGVSIQSQVKDLLAAKKSLQRASERPRQGIESEQSAPGATESAKTLIQTQAPVPDCVRQAVGSPHDVLGAKAGTYAGKSAYLVVVPDNGDRTRVTAYVVDASCIVQQSISPGKVLLKQSLARP